MQFAVNLLTRCGYNVHTRIPTIRKCSGGDRLVIPAVDNWALSLIKSVSFWCVVCLELRVLLNI